MKTALVYTEVLGRTDPSAPPPEYYRPFSERFLRSYREFKGDSAHDFIILTCGGEGCYMGLGWDIGAFQHVARSLRGIYDFVICANSTVYFWRPGVVARLIEVREEYGDGLYGTTASFERTPHIRSTCFAFDPETFTRYPLQVSCRDDCFSAESGPESFTKWYQTHDNLKARLVTWDGVYEQKGWRTPPNIFRRGDQSNCLVRDRHTDIYDKATMETKKQLETWADGL